MRQPDQYTKAIQDSLKQVLEQTYSKIDGKNKSIELNNITFDPIPESDNYAKQKKILLNKETEGVNFYGDVRLVDKESGKIIDEKKKLKLGLLPTVTDRHSFIINGKEYNVFNQLRLQPGIYTKIDQNGLPVAGFNLEKGKNMQITYVPAKERMMLKIENTNIPLYTLLKDVYNLPESKLIEAFGKEFHGYQIDKYKNDSERYLNNLYKALTGNEVSGRTPNQMAIEIKERLSKTSMNPEITKMTTGKEFSSVTSDSILEGAKQVLGIHQGKINPSERDNLAFKSVLSAEDFIKEKFTKLAPQIKNKIKFKLDKSDKIMDTGISRQVRETLNDFFTKSRLVNYSQQINPMEFLESSHKITSIGEGAISDVHSLPIENRDIHWSFGGFIDPVRTPDNMRAGADVRTAMSAWKEGNTLKSLAFNKSGQPVEVSPAELFYKTYSMLNQKSTIKENGQELFPAFRKGNIVYVPKKEIDFFVKPDYAFTPTTAYIPFLESNQGQRCAMGAKMLTQALSLKDRETPLISTDASKLIENSYVPKSKVDGVVEKINKDTLEIRDENGNIHHHNVPNNFPLNYHSFLDFTPLVKPGDKVKQGDVLGDTNFSRNGKMALGVNLNVAYMPYKGLNNDDAFVITQQGADKLTSLHTFIYELPLSPGIIADKEKFRSYYPNKYSVQQLMKIQNSIIKQGAKVEPGDPLILALRKKSESPEVLMIGKMSSRISNPYEDISISWDKDYPGEVIEVVSAGDHLKVIVKAESPMVIGSKLAGRYGNKGVVAEIIPNHLAPKKENGEIPDIIMNPSTIPSRMNVGQTLETGLAKIIKNKGLNSQYIQNFSGVKNIEEMEKAMDKAGIKGSETYIDPETGKKIPNVFNGYQYILKLFKEAETAYSARSTGKYDIDLRPMRGGVEGSKAIGMLDFYGVLAHKGGNRALLSEMGTLKAEYNPEFWSSLLQGKPLPAPKPTFAFNKFIGMMQGMGINLQKNGNTMKLIPFTDKDIEKISNGEITKASTVFAKPDEKTGLPFRPETNGLFDPAKTGGLKGTNFTHINLAVPVVNSMFEKPIRTLLNLKQDEFKKISEGSKTVTINNEELTGGKAIHELLKSINPKTELDKLKTNVLTTKSITKKDDMIKKIKYLQPLVENKLLPHEAYTFTKLPVIPPAFRPIYPDSEGKMVVSDANHLYKEVIEFNNQMKSPLMQALDHNDPIYQKAHRNLFNSIKKLQGLDGTTDSMDFSAREPKGFLQTIVGTNAKYGYFQNKLVSKVQDLVGRSVITPDTKLGIDELGIPEPMAWELYTPFIIGELSKSGYALPQATEEVKNRTQLARNILQSQMKERPVILNRAPTLHKFNMMAFKPSLTNGKQITMPSLVNRGFNADYDGDTVLSSVFCRFKLVDIKSINKYNTNGNIYIEENIMTFTNKILYQNGLINLRDFPRIEETKIVKDNKEFYKVPQGVEVLTLNNEGEFKWLQVDEYSIHKNLIMNEISTHKNRTVQASNDHSFVTLDSDLNIIMSKAELNMLIPCKVSPVFQSSIYDLKLEFKDRTNRKHTFRDRMELNYFTGHLIGCIVGDGWVSSVAKDKGAICFASITQELNKQWKKTIEKYIVSESEVVHLSSVNCDHVYEGFECKSNKITWFSAGEFALLIKDWVGHGAQKKHLPPFFLESPIDFRKGLLAGLLDTDGTVSINSSGIRKNKSQANISICTTSYQLAHEIIALSNSLGYICGLQYSQTPKGEPCYYCIFDTESILKIKKEILLYHPEKANKLKQIRDNANIEREKYGPPLTVSRLNELRKIIGAPRVFKRGTKTPSFEGKELEIAYLKRNLNAEIAAQIKKLDGRCGHLTLGKCKEIISLNLSEINEDPFWLRWKDWVLNPDVSWERITDIKPLPFITEAYDLTIPPAYTMVTESGIVVWDSLNVHMPVAPDAVKEAWKMLPSNNLFNPLNKNPMFMPDQEAVMGLYQISTPKQNTPIMKFKSIEDAKKAYHDGKIDINDHIEVQNK